MTIEEAKKLKIGDRVLVEAEVIDCITGESPYIHITAGGDVAMKSASAWSKETFYSVAPEAIREKIMPPRRKFKKGDIVRFNEVIRYVLEDEDQYGVLVADHEDAEGGSLADFGELTLLCAVEDRADRKGDA